MEDNLINILKLEINMKDKYIYTYIYTTLLL